MAWQGGAAKAAYSRTWVPFIMPRTVSRTVSRKVLSLGSACWVIRLEAVARPGDLHHGAVIGKDPVGKRHLGAGALKQRAGDEHAEPEPGMLVLGFFCAGASRQIGLADPFQHVGRDTRPVVGDHDLDAIGVPPRVHLDGVPCKIDGIFQDVADAVEDRRVSWVYRLRHGGV